MKLIAATNNAGKQEEISALLEDWDVELVLPQEIGLNLHVKEDGDTYLANARRKASAFSEATDLWALADDSGLEVEALNDAPGLYSARFAPEPNATDADRRTYLLQKLVHHPRPWRARFRCTVVLLSPAGEAYSAVGICRGEIIPEERGEQGFGYDPIFYLPEKNKTMAEMSLAEKNRVSHRAHAVRALEPSLLEILER
jgi:XTP/dITP diphosphohydrolase